MADVTITNLTSEPVLLQEMYITLKPNEAFAITRERDELHAMPALQQLWKDGTIEVDVVSDVAEDDFIDQKLHLFGGESGAIRTATRTFHEPTISPEAGTNAPGQAPNLEVIGTTLVAEFTLNTDSAYRLIKIPSNYVTGAAFHVHWTKEAGAAGDGNQSGKTVRWRISYTVFGSHGPSPDDINVLPTVIDLDDAYDDAGTTTRIAYSTPNISASGFESGHYVGIKVEAVTPAGSALTCEPALITADLTYTEYINQ
jgi:hypothetical protein